MSHISDQRQFFICGLPRSRTAWLANLLTCGTCFCSHELIRQTCSVASVAGVFRGRGKPFVGDSGTWAHLFFDELDEMFPYARWVFVRNDFEACVVSFFRAFPEFAGEELKIRRSFLASEVILEDVASLLFAGGNFRAIQVNSEDLDGESQAEAVWNFCAGPGEFDRARYQMLRDLRVSVVEQSFLQVPENFGEIAEQIHKKLHG